MTFQTFTNQTPAPAVAGDFASQNPRSTVAAGPGGLVAGSEGVTIGRFAWLDLATQSVVHNFGAGAPNGIVANVHNALITTFLGSTSYVIPGGYQMSIFRTVDIWVKNDSALEVTPGLKAYASNATGQAISFAPTATPPAGGNSSAASIAASTGSFTASIALVPSQTGPGTNPAVMTVTVVGSGTVVPGGTLSGTNVQTGTMVISQLLPLLAGEATGGVGRYYVNTPQTTASTTISETYGTLTVGGTVTGTFGVGDAVTGTNIAVPTYISALGTGTGQAGTYIVSPTQTAASAAVVATSATETDWVSHSFAAPGELVKITNSAKG